MTLTEEQLAKIGKSCRDAEPGNMLVGSFAAELVGESYPFSKNQCNILFKGYHDVELGKRFVQWIRSNEK